MQKAVILHTEDNVREGMIMDNNFDNKRSCPSCDLESLKGMPGGKDSVCENCGYKDPCCYD